MPRRPRHYLPHVPCHVVQRGNNRTDCFLRDLDRVRYLNWLREAAEKYRCAVHAYVLMTNHVHLLLTPETEEGISRTMQSLGRHYVQFFNLCHGRTGTLWEGRHHASLVDTEAYLFTCARYIESNPVRAGMVDHPGDFRWSSYAANAHGQPDLLIRPHGLYESLGDTTAARQRAYRELFDVPISDNDLHSIRSAAHLGLPLGSVQFVKGVEQRLERSIAYRPPGRPRRIDSDPIFRPAARPCSTR